MSRSQTYARRGTRNSHRRPDDGLVALRDDGGTMNAPSNHHSGGTAAVAERDVRAVRERLARIRAEDRSLIRRHRRGDRRAREILVERYLPLTRSLARRYRHGREPLDDLFQVAAVGLLKAVDRWDPDHGSDFSSYAVPTVLGELRRHFRDATWAVRPPRDLQELCLSIHDARKALNAELGREPTVADLGERLHRSPEEIVEALQAGEARSASWLDAPIHDQEHEHVTVGDLIAVADLGYDRAEARITVEHLTSLLDHRAREVLHLRFERDLTQRAISRRIGVSQMHVSRIIRSALEELFARSQWTPAHATSTGAS
jgi:RNA polymerase sigma-B factor